MKDAFLLDTGVASVAWDGGNPNNLRIRQRLLNLGDSSLSICAVTMGEILYGLDVSPAVDPSRHEMVRNAMSSYFIWNIDSHTADVYAQLRGRLFEQYSPRNKRGRLQNKHVEDLTDPTTAKELGIQENDLWIMSVAVSYNLSFVTMDAKMHPIFGAAKEIFSYERVILWEETDSGKN
jgi:tRNA(fMet)-specific endonuclease VapC